MSPAPVDAERASLRCSFKYFPGGRCLVAADGVLPHEAPPALGSGSALASYGSRRALVGVAFSISVRMTGASCAGIWSSENVATCVVPPR